MAETDDPAPSNRRSHAGRDFKPLVLGQFETDVAMALIEFGKALRDIDADVLMFMARKSLCIYDVLVRLGIPPVERCVVSDRVLDMRLDSLRGKRVALVDDTLILGTTLAKTRKRLLDAGVADVSVHVFCIDEKWWCPELVNPDTVALRLPDERVMTFCTGAVRAMSLLPRPYLVDFPLSRPLKIPADEAQCFLSNIEWRAYNISTFLQRTADVSSLSFFPNADAQEKFAESWGHELWNLVDILKVRGFARKLRDVYWLQIVPIVVLKPISTADLDRTLRHCLARVGTLAQGDRQSLLHYASSPGAQQRLLQYLLSSIVGHHFTSRIKLSLSRPIRFTFDMQETDRHYGPWLHNPMKALTSCQRLGDAPQPEDALLSEVSPRSVPTKVQEWSTSSLPKANGPASDLFQDNEVTNLIPDFSEIFLAHYDKRELPARKEAKRLGARLLSSPDSSHLNRLDIGLPWQQIVEYLVRLHNTANTKEVEQAFSLALDFCNDQGIAVPITCIEDDVVFRAYRHGEDVKFTDAEVALAYETVKGYLEGTKTSAIPKLKLEKLLVLLLKVGVARKFLEPLLISPAGVQEVLRIGFYLRGAVPILARGPRDRAGRENWFSRYLVRREVLIEQQRGRYEAYALGEPVDGNYNVSTAPVDAYELGHIIGLLTLARKDPHRSGAPLDDDAITLLASCGSPRHAAASIQVELDIFREWFEDTVAQFSRKLQWSKADAVKKVYKKLIVSHGHNAIYGVRLKYVGYKSGSPERIVDACGEYLGREHGNLLKRKWLSYWNATKVLEASGEKAIFEPLMDAAACVAWRAAQLLLVIEICLVRYLQLHSEAKTGDCEVALKKYREYNQMMVGTGLEQPEASEQVEAMIAVLNDSPCTDTSVISTVNTATRELARVLPQLVQRAEAMSPMIEEYGRLFGRHDYTYMVYYDIVDSTGTVAGRQGVDLGSYRGRVMRLKQFLNDGYRQLSQEAWKAASEVFCWNGNQSSTNDCKHVFVGGTSANNFLGKVLDLLARSMEAVPGVHLRIYVVPCNFVGTSAYRQEWDTEVSGDRFWEHWSRLLKAGKQYEQAVGPGRCFLLVAVQELIQRLTIPSGWAWGSTEDAQLPSEIELLVKTTLVRYGALVARPRGARKMR